MSEMIPADQFDPLRETAATHLASAGPGRHMDAIQAMLGEALPALEVTLQEATAGPEPLDESARQLVFAGGKRVRPTSTLLVAKACGGEVAPAVPLAAAVELIHSATLLHDDVMDEGEQRRGRTASRLLWGNLVSVLSGDLLLTRALQLLQESGVDGVLADALSTMQALIAGEVAQLKARGREDIGIDGYLEIARGKTASLFAHGCRSGARSAGAPDAMVEAAGRFGAHVGIGFQIVDDVLDLQGVPHEVGKQLGHDLAEGKTTLPLALALQDAASELRPLLIDARAGDAVAAARVSQRPEVRAACERARGLALEETERGLSELRQLPESKARDLLEALVRGLIYRDH